MEREPTLDQILADPIICLLMRRDGVEAQEIRDLIEALRALAAPTRT